MPPLMEMSFLVCSRVAFHPVWLKSGFYAYMCSGGFSSLMVGNGDEAQFFLGVKIKRRPCLAAFSAEYVEA